MFKNQIKHSYQDVSEEYYVQNLHPTSANFRLASQYFIREVMDSIPRPDQLSFLEVGAGRSIAGEIFEELHYPLKNLYITDLHESMLSYSREYAVKGAHLKVCDAEDTTADFAGIDYLISSLGDPYNTRKFWESTYNVLKPNGYCIFTTPSLEWSMQFREKFQHGDMHHAHFVLKNGAEVNVPSYIHTLYDQVELVTKVGFTVLKHQNIYLKDIPGYISPKLRLSQGSDLAIVTGYLLQKCPNN